MSSVPVMISGVIWDQASKSGRAVTLMGQATIAGLEIGGGPIYPGGGGGQPEHPIYYPPGIWGPTDPRPGWGLPGGGGGAGGPPGIWGGGNVPMPTPPIHLPPEGGKPPEGQPDKDGFVKPPPEGGGWAYHKEYGWLYSPGGQHAGPKAGQTPAPAQHK